MKVKDLVDWGKKELSFLASAEKETLDLFSFFLKTSRYNVLFFEEVLSHDQIKLLVWAIEQRKKRVPFAYITQEIEFYGSTFFINDHVLVPRPETELLVEHIIKKISSSKKGILWDFCSGSGVIGISVKKKLPHLQVILSDISTHALDVAKCNAEKNGVEVQIRQSDLFKNFANEKCDFFVCNPPYLSEEEYQTAEKELFFEPKLSLVAENQGYFFYQKIAEQLPFFLNERGRAFLEIGSQQKEEIIKIFSKISYSMQIENDWAGHPRFFFLE